jgi:hypothetical protein
VPILLASEEAWLMAFLCVNSRWVAIPLVATRLSCVPARQNAVNYPRQVKRQAHLRASK